MNKRVLTHFLGMLLLLVTACGGAPLAPDCGPPLALEAPEGWTATMWVCR